MPVEPDEIERKLRQHEMEKQAVMKEDSKDAKEKLNKIKRRWQSFRAEGTNSGRNGLLRKR